MAPKAKTLHKAIEAVNQQGALLVFPLANRKEPASLWSALYPRSKMRWEWDEDGDNRVAELWHLRETLSRSRDVVYTKWYQGRATLFSNQVFVWLLAYFQTPQKQIPLGREARNVLEALEMDSPLSTKQVKEAAELQGKSFESLYNRTMKQLWNPLLVVGFGEIQDSSFPSLAIGATETIFEELWNQASQISSQDAEIKLRDFFCDQNLFWKFAQKLKKQN